MLFIVAAYYSIFDDFYSNSIIVRCEIGITTIYISVTVATMFIVVMVYQLILIAMIFPKDEACKHRLNTLNFEYIYIYVYIYIILY